MIQLKLAESINKLVYGNLEEIIQKLDTRWDLKLYAVITSDKGKNKARAVRIKRILTDNPNDPTEIYQESFDNTSEMFKILGHPGLAGEEQIDQFLDNPQAFRFQLDKGPEDELIETTLHEQTGSEDSSRGKAAFPHNNQTRSIMYASCFHVEQSNKRTTISYILSIDNTDPETVDLFYRNPWMSFVRMALDYYFMDFYESKGENVLVPDELEDIGKKYKEDSTQFLQRMTRLFMGKIQDFIEEGRDLTDFEDDINYTMEPVNNRYYINTLQEKLEGISTRTYEGKSPFGCLLLMNRGLLERDSLVTYAIKFEGAGHRISLEDDRKIRKLLEMTNNEKDLYLIADEASIYGIGQLNWNEARHSLIYKVEFKGLSRYDVMLATTKESKTVETRLDVDDEKKVLKITTGLELLSLKLIHVSFKRPSVSDGGFTSQKFRQIIKAQFDKPESPVPEENIEKLQLVVQKAREQQKGTMVVITDQLTAEKELDKLRKQSTPITPTEIRPAFIKHLTAIDGAIYYDITGTCHAIGVILDGLAEPGQGDSSRGARYHSAYRYMEKLRGSKPARSCVIVIISEDGMINLIPEQPSEAYIRQLFLDYMGYINETNPLAADKLQEYDKRLEEVAEKAAVDHHHYFVLADTFMKKVHYAQARIYYEKGLTVSGQFILTYKRSLMLACLNRVWSDNLLKQEKISLLRQTMELAEELILKEESVVRNDYNCRGLALTNLARVQNDAHQNSYRLRALDDFSKCLQMSSSYANMIYYNRALLYKDMDRLNEALDDFISAELISPSDKYLKEIIQLAQKDASLFLYAVASYAQKKTGERDSEKLREWLTEYGETLAQDNEEAAAALSQWGLLGGQPENG
ncbi:MAG: hypothetical protein K0R57_4610 [Paenibacillaceae bacterium]|nr:hypothetical protein [Paenibacillaceae bacterium]